MSPSTPRWTRKRPWHALAVICVIGLGLASRRFPGLFPAILGKYPGDSLWALMVFLGWGIIFPLHPTVRLGCYALATSFLVEFFKLCQPAWLAPFRDTTVGQLIFGYVFSWQNLVAYAVGIMLGIIGEWIAYARPIRTDRSN